MTDHFRHRTRRYVIVSLRWLTIAAFVGAATMSAGIYVTDHVLTKTYAATASMELQQSASPSATPSTPSAAVSAQFESVESPAILELVIADLDLDRVWAGRIFKQTTPLTIEEASRYLKSNLRLNYKHGRNVVGVTATSDDPKEAADIANAVVDHYKADRGTAGSGNPVSIISRAEVPVEPSRPNRRICYALTAGLAGVLSVMIATCIEVCMLIARAEETARELELAR